MKRKATRGQLPRNKDASQSDQGPETSHNIGSPVASLHESEQEQTTPTADPKIHEAQDHEDEQELPAAPIKHRRRQKLRVFSHQPDDQGQASDTDEQLTYPNDSVEVATEGTVYHHEIFDTYVHIASEVGSYEYPPAGNVNTGDVTSFRPNQSKWALEWVEGEPSLFFDNRPRRLQLWEPKGIEHVPQYQPKGLIFNGKVVLDWEGYAITNFVNLPWTISSQVEWWRMEAWIRKDPRITYKDIAARIRTYQTPDGNIVPIQNHETLRSRTSRERRESGMMTWSMKDNLIPIKEFIDSLRSHEEKTKNWNLRRPLTQEELSRLALAGQGTRNIKKPGMFREQRKKYLENRVRRFSAASQHSATAISSSDVVSSQMQAHQNATDVDQVQGRTSRENSTSDYAGDFGINEYHAPWYGDEDADGETDSEYS